MAKHKKWNEFQKEFLADAESAQHYLDIAFEDFQEDGDKSSLLKALRAVTEAQGGIGKLSENVDVKRESLYRALSESGNPTVETLCSVLKGLHLRIRIEPMPEPSRT